MKIKLYEIPEKIITVVETYDTTSHKYKAVAYIGGLQDNDTSKRIIEGAYKMAIEGNKLHPFFRKIDNNLCFTIPEGGYINHITTLDGTGVTWYHESMKALGACFRDMNVQYYINYGKGLERITYEEAKEIIVKSWNCTYTYAANALDEHRYFDCGSCQIYKDSFNCKNW